MKIDKMQKLVWIMIFGIALLTVLLDEFIESELDKKDL